MALNPSILTLKVFKKRYLNILLFGFNLSIILLLVLISQLNFAKLQIFSYFNVTQRPYIDPPSSSFGAIYSYKSPCHADIMFYFFISLIVFMMFISSWSPRKIGLMYIVLAVRFFGCITRDLLIIWGSALAAIWGPLAITQELKVVYNYNPIYVLLLPILVILMMTIGLTLFLVPDRFFNIYAQYNINYNSPSYYHNVRFNFLAIILLISYSLPKLLAVVYLSSYYNIVLYFLAMLLLLFFCSCFLRALKNPQSRSLI